MSNFLQGFGDELVKLGVGGLVGSASKAGRFAVKHPLLSLGAGATVAGTAMAAREGHRRGMAGAGKRRFIAATVDPYTGGARPSRTALLNHNFFLGNKRNMSKRLSKKYDEDNFKG